MALCNSCGEKMLDDGDSCQHCGTSSGAEPAESKYKSSTTDKTVITIVVICVSVLVFWCLLVGFSFWVDYYSSGGFERSNNSIALMHGRHLLTCFESHYADYQRYPLSIDELQWECNDYLDKNGVIDDLRNKNVVLNATLLNKEDYEFVIFHKKGNRQYKMNSYSSRIGYREKGQKEWRNL